MHPDPGAGLEFAGGDDAGVAGGRGRHEPGGDQEPASVAESGKQGNAQAADDRLDRQQGEGDHGGEQ